MTLLRTLSTVTIWGALSLLLFPCTGAGATVDSTALHVPVPSADTCTNPFEIANITVVNTLCGFATGTINITVAGGNNGYSFSWNPNVSSTNFAAGLPAAAYTVTIIRNNEPVCRLDTTLIVNNINGPAVQIASVQPSNCLASNGKVTLSPTNLFYVWNNGEVGAVNDGLLSICYYVTATDPNGGGCYSVIEVCVPNVNPLQTTVEVLEQAKCGRGTGKAQVTVTGGSGVYAYSLGPTSTLMGLTAGNQVNTVVDNISGCMDTVSFTILDLPVSGSVEITPYNINCPGGSNGFVGFEVIPGANFELPYTFYIRDTNAVQYSPGNLVAGKYYLFIADADSCFLPVDSFIILEPAPIVTQALIVPETCEEGGKILLTLSGGNGGYRVDWLDLPGAVNTEDRINLASGIYRAVVYDSLFCTDSLDAYLIPSLCARRDTIPLLVAVGATDSICLDIPIGLQPDDLDFQLVGASAAGLSTYGSWSLSASGCLVYTAGPVSGFAVDTICISTNIGLANLSDTTCVIITIPAQPPTMEQVFFTVMSEQVALACGNIPASFTDPVVMQLYRPGLSGTSDAYGFYNINPTTACLNFTAYALPAFNVDTITVAVCDLSLERCHVIAYIPTVLPPMDCSNFLPEDSVLVLTTDCVAGDFVCIPINYSEIVDYVLYDNGLPYAGGYLGCDLDTVIAYATSLLPLGGPYQLNQWLVNGQSFSGAFQDVTGLVALLNQLDPNPGWNLQNNLFIVGGSSANNYGAITVTSAQAVVGVLQPNLQFVPQGTELRFTTGRHELIMRHIQTGCTDTLTVNVECVDCPPIHNYPLDVFGYIEWEAPDCQLDTLFCTNMLASEFDDYIVTDNGIPIQDFELCGNFAGLRFDTGYHQIRINNLVNTCSYVVIFYLDCPNIIIADTLVVSLTVGQVSAVCPNQTLLDPPIVSIFNVCDDDDGNVSFTYDQQNFCAVLTANTPGQDTLCLEICNGNGDCAITSVIAIVTPATQDTVTEAYPDQALTPKNSPVSIPVIANDIVENGLGNLPAVYDLIITTQPTLGLAQYDPSTGTILYTPADDTCGTDFLIYRLTDSRGVTDTARVDIRIACDELLVFTGFSPNGDNANDLWHILGIEDYPSNLVQVFNRWGNLVFEQKGYTNQAAWDGRWNGKDLPDGTYFYLIELGKGQPKLSGYLQLMR